MFALFGLAILAGWVGWGVLVARLLLGGPAARRLGWGMEAALGIAGLLPVGGALDHAGLVTPAALWALLVVGWVALGWRAVERRRAQPRPAVAVAWALPLAVGALVACGWIACQEVDAFHHELEQVLGYNANDDLAAYAVFPLKMIQTGTQGFEPFSERRLTTPGGQAFLQCFALLVGDDRALNVVDPALCLVVVAALFAEQLRGLGARRRALLVLVPLVVAAPRVNVSALFTGAALFLALFRITDPREGLGGDLRGAALVALFAAGLVSLKASFVGPLGLFLLASQLGAAIAARSARPLLHLAGSAALALALLAPWMASSKESCGTWLYPFFGRGNHVSAFGTYLPIYLDGFTPAALLANVLGAWTDLAALALLGCGAVAIAVTRGPRRVWCAALLGSAIASKAALFMANGFYTQRYAFPVVFVATLALLACAARELFSARALPGRGRALSSVTLLAAVLALLFAPGRDAPARYLRALGQRLLWPSHGGPARSDERARRARMQAAVPAGEVLLARLATLHLLDFVRNPIRLIDLPGGAGPPPGMPLDRGPDALADYLLGQSVRYVAYDYVQEAGLPAAVYRPFLHHHSPMLRGQTERALAFQQLLMELVPGRRIVHDDGLTFVMDLASPR